MSSTFALSQRDAYRPSSYWTLYWLSLRVSCRPGRLAVVIGLFCIPVALTMLGRWFDPPTTEAAILTYEENLVYFWIAGALAPLIALLFASGMIQDEIEQQTLTYLLIRPLSRPLVYVTKLAAAITVTYLLVALFTAIGFTAIHLGNPAGDWPGVLLKRGLPTMAVFALTIPVYAAVFGLIGMMTRWTLAIGAAYVIVIDFYLSEYEFMIRQLAVLYHFRAICQRWMDLKFEAWAIDLDYAPEVSTSILCLAGIAAVAAIAGSVMMRAREFRVKTTEGG